MHGFSINMQSTIIFIVKCKLPVSSWPVRTSILTTCAMWSCTGNFLICARDCDVWINCFLSNDASLIAFHDFLKYHNFRCKLRFNKYHLTICQMYNKAISDVLHEMLHQLIFKWQISICHFSLASAFSKHFRLTLPLKNESAQNAIHFKFCWIVGSVSTNVYFQKNLYVC